MEDFKTIYVLLTHTGTLFTHMIKMITREPHNHASIAFDRDLRSVYSFGRRQPRNPLSAGFVKEDLRGRLFGNAECALYSCRVSVEVYEQMRSYIRSMESNRDDYKYNLIGLLGVMLNIEFERENAYFCSQFVAKVFERGGLPVTDKPASLVTPGDLGNSAMLRLEYEGRLDHCLRRPAAAASQAAAGGAVRTA